jgi:hypothetical protein
MRKAVQIALSIILGGGAILSTLGTTASCVEDRPLCYDGDFQACTCANAASGYQQCVQQGGGFAPCVCDGTTPGVDGSIEAGKAPDVVVSDGGKIGFMGECTANEECETDNCRNFPSRGNFCTHSCKLTSDCPPPSGGCNPQGVCKAPQ